MEYRIYYEQGKAVKDASEERPKGDTRPARYLPETKQKVKGGKVIAVVQKDDVQFFVGERVRVLSGGDGVFRIEKM